MTIEELRRRTTIQQAFLDNKPVEYVPRDGGFWARLYPHSDVAFDWDVFEYRVVKDADQCDTTP